MSNIINCIYEAGCSLLQSATEKPSQESDQHYFRLEPELLKAIEIETKKFVEKHGRSPTLQEHLKISQKCYSIVFESRGLDAKSRLPGSFCSQQQRTHSSAASLLNPKQETE